MNYVEIPQSARLKIVRAFEQPGLNKETVFTKKIEVAYNKELDMPGFDLVEVHIGDVHFFTSVRVWNEVEKSFNKKVETLT